MRLRYRPFQAVAIATLAALITACAAFAPLYDRAMRQALSDLGIAHATPAEVGIQLRGTAAPDSAFGASSDQEIPTPESVAATVPESMRASYLEPILGYSATVTRSPGQLTDPRGLMIWRTGMCDHLTFVEGACPAAAGEVAVSEADAEKFGLHAGSSFRALVAQDCGSPTSPRCPKLVVTGVYRQRPSPYWFGLNLTGRSGVTDPTPPSAVQHDVWLTTRDTFAGGAAPGWRDESSAVAFPLDSDAVGVDDVLTLSDQLETLVQKARGDTQGNLVDITTALPDVANDIRDQTEQSRVTVPLLMAQLGLLGVVVLWLVLLAVTEQRRPEVALARLRGRGRRGARSLLLGELLPVALAGVVPGVLLALAASWFARTVVLPGSAPFELGLRLLAAVAIAVAVLGAVTVLAVVRVASEPVETLLRRVPPRRSGWGLGVGDALVIAGAGGIVLVFATGGLDGPIALAAPGLLAIVVGLVLAHVTTPTAAIAGRRLLRRGRVQAGVSVLDAARSPATRRIVAIVTLAAALAVFSADALLVGERNRETASEQQAGAPLALDINGVDLASVRAALAEVDPEGQRATPVVRILPPAAESVGTLAVVPEEFRRIALFPGGAPPATDWDRVAVSDAQPIMVTGTSIGVDVDGSTILGTRSDGEPTPISLGLDLVTSTGETLHTVMSDLDGPIDHARLERTVSCADGCFVTGVWLRTLPGARINGHLTFSNLSGTGDDGTTTAQMGPASQWTPFDDRAEGRFEPLSSTPDELTIRVQTRGPSEVTMKQVWLPSTVPALVSGHSVSDAGDNEFRLVGLNGEIEPAAQVAALDRVPASGPETALVNLDLVERGVALAATAQVEVWLGDDSSDLVDRVEAALADHGVTTTGTRSLAEIRTSYGESAAAWALQLALAVGIASLLIALLVLVVSAVSSWRFRTRDLAALRMSGVPGRSIGSMAVASQLPAVVVGVVAGSIAGLVGAQLALPLVPLFADAPKVSTLDLSTAWGAVVVAALTALVVLGLGSVLIGRAMARRSDVRRLRETM